MLIILIWAFALTENNSMQIRSFCKLQMFILIEQPFSETLLELCWGNTVETLGYVYGFLSTRSQTKNN